LVLVEPLCLVFEEPALPRDHRRTIPKVASTPTRGYRVAYRGALLMGK